MTGPVGNYEVKRSKRHLWAADETTDSEPLYK